MARGGSAGANGHVAAGAKGVPRRKGASSRRGFSSRLALPYLLAPMSTKQPDTLYETRGAAKARPARRVLLQPLPMRAE